MTDQKDNEPNSEPGPEHQPDDAARQPENLRASGDVSDDEVDQLFAELVTRFGQSGEPSDGPLGTAVPQSAPAEGPRTEGAPDPGSTSETAVGWRAWKPAEPEDENYEPEDEPIVISRDPVVALGWFGVIAGPILLLVIVIGWQSAPAWLTTSAVVAFVGGFAALVTRMPNNRSDADDDGAVL